MSTTVYINLQNNIGKYSLNHMKLFYSKTEKLHIGNAFNAEGQDPQLTSSSFHWTLPVYPSWRSAPEIFSSFNLSSVSDSFIYP